MSAAAHHLESIQDPGPLRAPGLKSAGIVLVVLGLAAFIGMLATGQTERAWSSFLQGMLIPTYIGLGATFFIAVHSVANAKWNIPLRRIMEGFSSGIYIGAAGFIAIAAFGGAWLYDWFNLAGASTHHDLFHVNPGSKESMMNPMRFIITNGLIFLAWLVLRDRLVKLSLRQDETKENIRGRHRRIAIAFLPVFALGFTFFIWDMLLSLHVNWFSTMWGVYCFSSAVQTFLCVLVLTVIWLRRSRMKHIIQEHTMHDVGTWMVGWSCFCAYIGFSQYMLIWYANLDEETFYYALRTQHGWGQQYAIEALIRWPLVFLGLMSQSVRTKAWALVPISIVCLIGNWMDWNWIIQPAFSPNEYRSPFHWQELLVGAGFAGAFILLAGHFWSRHGLIPKGEPRLLATVNAEHLH